MSTGLIDRRIAGLLVALVLAAGVASPPASSSRAPGRPRPTRSRRTPRAGWT